MRRRKDEAAIGEVCLHQFREPRLRCDIERAGRLVEQPKRALDGEKARNRQPPLLPRR